MSARLHRKPRPPRHGADDMAFDLHRSRRGRPGRKLRVERGGNAVRPFGRRRRPGVEQAKIPRVIDVDEALLQLGDGPRQQPLGRDRRDESRSRRAPIGRHRSRSAPSPRRHRRGRVPLPVRVSGHRPNRAACYCQETAASLPLDPPQAPGSRIAAGASSVAGQYPDSLRAARCDTQLAKIATAVSCQACRMQAPLISPGRLSSNSAPRC